MNKPISGFLKNLRIGGIHQLAAGAVMISFSAVFVKLADVGPTTSAFYRMLFGGIVLLAIAFISGNKLRFRLKVLYAMIICGVFFAVDLTLWHRSVLSVGPGLATMLANFQVFFLAGFGIIVLDEKLTIRYALSVPLALFGLYLLVGPDWSTVDPHYKLGVLLGLLAALAYSAYLLVLRKLQSWDQSVSPFAAIAVISLASAAILGVEMVLQRESFAIPHMKSLASLVSYGVMGQVLGWVLISKGITAVDASRTGLVLLLQPSLSFIWDITFFDRPTSHLDILGCVITLSAIYMGSAESRNNHSVG